MLKTKLELKESVKLAQNIGKAATNILDKVIQTGKKDILTDVQSVTKQLLYRSKFFINFINGDLKQQLGIPSGEEYNRLSTIIETIINDIELNITPLKYNNGRTAGGIQIGIGRNAWENIIQLSSATVTTDKGETLEWLKWILKDGDKVVISEHDVNFLVGLGRSGGAIMVKSNATGWRVPSEFSGTTNDNWITREIKRNIELYVRIINNTISRKLKAKFS